MRKESLTRQTGAGREDWRPLARHLAKRFAGGAADELLTEVALTAMADAERRFDSGAAEFASVAVPMIIRALRRYRCEQARNRTTSDKPLPRQLALVAADDELSRQLRRTPTIAEVAAHMGVTQDEILTRLGAGW